MFHSDSPLFDSNSIMRRINREPIITLCAPRALLLQIAHPAIAAGVADHSYWNKKTALRLWRTLWLLSQIIFGKRKVALSAAATINRRHHAVKGWYQLSPDEGPIRYRALDPELGWWVIATLAESAFKGYERWIAPLDREECEQYLQECKELAALFGIQPRNMPEDFDAFQEYLRAMIHGKALVYNQRSIEMAHAILRWPPYLSGYASGLTLSFLPEPVRRGFGFRWTERDERFWSRHDAWVRQIYGRVPRLLRVNPIVVLTMLM